MTQPALIITRPEPYAASTVKSWEAKGYRVWHCPLATLTPLPCPAPEALEHYTHGVFVSRMAADTLCPHYAAPPTWQVVSVGRGTTETLTQQGWPVHQQPEKGFGSQALLSSWHEPLNKAQIAIFCGNQHHPGLDQSLRHRGANVDPIEVYRTQPHPNRLATIKAALAEQPTEVLLTSPHLEALWDEALEVLQHPPIPKIRHFYRTKQTPPS